MDGITTRSGRVLQPPDRLRAQMAELQRQIRQREQTILELETQRLEQQLDSLARSHGSPPFTSTPYAAQNSGSFVNNQQQSHTQVMPPTSASLHPGITQTYNSTYMQQPHSPSAQYVPTAPDGRDNRYDSRDSTFPYADHYVPQYRYSSIQEDIDSPRYNMRPQNCPPSPHDHTAGSSTREDEATLLKKLVDMMTKKNDRLPKLEPTVFTGDILKYVEWIRSFESIIEHHTDSPSERLFYLGRYTSGEARATIQWLLTSDSSIAYAEAKSTLQKRFGDKYKISEAYRKQLDKWPVIKPGDGTALRGFSDFLNQCCSAINSISYLSSLDSAEENKRLLMKLPRYLVNRWSRIVDSWLYGTEQQRPWHQGTYEGQYPRFSVFCKFVNDEARIACGPGNVGSTEKSSEKTFNSNNRQRNNRASSGSHKASAFYANTSQSAEGSSADNDKPEDESPTCRKCNRQNHTTDKCREFLKLTTEQRKAFARQKGLCYGCIRKGHLYTDCKRRNPELMYGTIQRNKNRPSEDQASSNQENKSYPAKEDQESAKPESAVSFKTEVNTSTVMNSMVVPVYVHHQDSPEKRIKTYALLDNQSNSCFVVEDLLDQLNIASEPVDLRLATMLSETVVKSRKVQGLIVASMSSDSQVSLPDTYSRCDIPGNRSLVPTPETIRKWPHLQHIAGELNEPDEDMTFGLLIGFNCSAALMPREIVTAGDHDPFAVKTCLGWGVTGVVDDCKLTSDCHSNCNFVESQLLSFRTSAKEICPSEVRKMFEVDFSEVPRNEKTSTQDRHFMKHAENSIHYQENKHFQMALPFKKENTLLPNNHHIAEVRLRGLKRKMLNNPQYKEDYTRTMSDLIDKGYAESVDTSTNPEGRQWYIPHHGVYHPQKRDKLRVVFDCSAECEGQSLNQNLLAGPDMINSLLGVICRFRKNPVTVSCDIESMFHQVNVNEADRDFLRFLWWKNGDLDSKPVVYRMTVHLFGATSSPGCVNYALKKTADMWETEFGSKAADFVRDDFYVDDGLTSVENTAEAIQLIENTQKLCAQGGFRLHKISSNCKDVVQSVPVKDRAKSIQDLNILEHGLPLESAVGIQWCLESDTLMFRVQIQDKPLTRRGLLSTVSSIFDPLGLISPYIVKAKMLLQQLCKDNTRWDDLIPEEVEASWLTWRRDLMQIADLKVPRSYRDVNMSTIEKVELHHFSDASQVGYGQCSYIRLVDQSNTVSTALVMAKSRVAPVKSITIPRMELQAAVVSVRVGNFLAKELKYNNAKHWFWTDSKVVLGYIANETKRFHVYVANRVQEIQESSETKQWNHVTTKENPADFTSRGMSADEILTSELWWKGPKFLSSPEFTPEIQDDDSNFLLTPSDPEVKKVVTHCTISSKSPLLEILERFSNWHKALKVVAICLRWKKKLERKTVKENHTKTDNQRRFAPVTVEEIKTAELVVLKAVQSDFFNAEYRALKKLGADDGDRDNARKRNAAVKRSSPLHKLDPFIAEDGLLRVGGRVRRADVPRTLAHPVILPKAHHITSLIISNHHERTCHSGRGITLNELRASGYWIIQARTAVASLIMNCVTCRKLKGRTSVQKMADLPPDRLEPGPAFTNVGVDYFGPFYVKEGRRTVKRWGCLFTCLSSRAVHLEVAHTLSTDSFLNAYRRFVARRGPVRVLRCDRGTNFVGAKNELYAALKELENDRLHTNLAKDGCDWIPFEMNPPHASHFGGVWERMIRTTRGVLSSLLDQHGEQLDDESLHTFLLEAEAIVNARPLTYMDTTSPDSPEPLTPNHILTLKSRVIQPPPGHFVREDLYLRKRWRRVQFLANQFWTRWRKEVLPTLQERKKWTSTEKNLEVGDVVLMTDETVPRNKWPKGIVTEALPSADNQVRKVRLRTATSTFDRPIHKLILLFRDQGSPSRSLNSVPT